VTDSNSSGRPLTPLQQSILDLVWSRDSATAEEVRDALKPRHVLSDSSVRTLLRRLEARGYLEHEARGKVFVYRARLAPQKLAARSVRQIIERFWSGSVEQFLVGMVDEKVLTRAEIERLARKVRTKK